MFSGVRIVPFFDSKLFDSSIYEEMKMAAAKAIASLISDEELRADYIIPAPFDNRVGPTVAKAVKEAAIATGVNRI